MEQPEGKELLKGFHFNSIIDWSKLPTEQNALVQEKLQVIKVKKKTLVYSMHDAPRGVYLIRKGKIKIDQVSYDGSTQILFIYTVGEAFGFRPLLGKEPHPVNAIALEDCELGFLPGADFLELLHTSITLSNMLLESLSHEFTVLVNRIHLFAQRGVKERLSFALLVLNEKYRNPTVAETEVEIKINRTDLAN